MSFLRRHVFSVDGDSPSADAFGRLRVSNPDTIFDSKFRYNLLPLVFQAYTANSAVIAHDANKASAKLSIATATDSEAILQSKMYHSYIPGKSHLIEMTQVFGAAVASVVRQAGYFDDEDGIFFEQNGTTDIAFTLRTKTSGSVSDANRVVQANWNLDTLDGNGPSKVDIDLSLAQILVFDLQFLGMGRVRAGFNVDGRVIYAHEFLNANNLAVPYMRTGTLPIRWRAKGPTACDMYATCASVQSEGGQNRDFFFTFAKEVSLTAGSGTQTVVMNLRPKSTFNSITNRIPIRLKSIEGLVTGTNPVLVEVYYGTSIGGSPSWTDMDATYSALQYDTAGTSSGGVKIAQFYLSASGVSRESIVGEIASRYPLVLDMAGTGYNHMTIFATGIGGTSACRVGCTWEEVR